MDHRFNFTYPGNFDSPINDSYCTVLVIRSIGFPAMFRRFKLREAIFLHNQKLIDAIHNAFDLLSQGYLLPPEKKPNSSEKDSFELINSVKVDKYKTNKQRFAMIRSLRITYEFGMNNIPVSVSIENCSARFKNRDGKITFDSATKQDVKNFTFHCTLAEWEAALSMIERQIQMFEMVHAAEAFRAANDL